MKIVLEVTPFLDIGIDADVQPDDELLSLQSAAQQAVVEECIRALQQYIIAVTLDPEVALVA
jgi:hypothetical protein